MSGAIEWTRARLDSTGVRAKHGGEAKWPNPIDRGNAGSKYHLSWSIGRGSRSPRCARRPMSTTAKLLEYAYPSDDRSANRAVPDSLRPNCTATKAATSTAALKRCGDVASRRGSPVALNRASGGTVQVGSWSGAMHGCLPSAAWPSASTCRPRRYCPSCTLPAHSSASASSSAGGGMKPGI
jgi:hypothetical protein